MADLVIRNADLVDGSGAPRRPADIVVDGGRVTEVLEAGTATTATAARVLDADGRLVTPGWVDVHTHYDAQVSWDPWVTPSSWHGVTTVVMGNCGVGFAPAAPDRHEWLIELMEGVEDIPGSAMTEGITWDWTTFPEYLDAVERKQRVLDVGAQIAHGPLRAFVMGERGAANEPATEAERAAMAALVQEALEAGALGFSTSRTPLHRSLGGELVPGTSADADELLAIGDAPRAAGHGVFQFAPDHASVPLDEWPWMTELARRSGRTVSVNLNQPDRDPEVWREVLRLLEVASTEGLPLVAQVAGRSIGILYCLHGSVHPLLFHPAYAEVAHLPVPERLLALAEPERRRRIVEDIPTDDGDLFKRGGARQAPPHVAGRRGRHRLRAG
jgi:N-acyl-D-amino-acid deacylase